MDRSGGERGVTAVAYALMVAIIAVLLVGGVFVLGGSVQSAFNHGGDCLVSPSDCGDGSGTGSGGGTQIDVAFGCGDANQLYLVEANHPAGGIVADSGKGA